MAPYKKLNDVITVTYEHSLESNSLLLYDRKQVFFGLEDADKKYEGNLTQPTYTISSDCDGCYATTISGDPGTSGTALIIKFYVSKNNSEDQRTITYKYNDTPLFKILQSGYRYFYFNKFQISSTSWFFNKPAYMIVIDNPYVNNIIIDSMQAIPPLMIATTKPIYMFYSLNSNYQGFRLYDTKFTYISGGGDILGDPTNNVYQQINERLGKYDSTTMEFSQITFSQYKHQIKYIGLFIKTDNGAYITDPLNIINFSQSSKYKIEYY